MRKLPEPHPDTPTLDGLRDAFGRLEADRSPRWGTMSAAQMAQHCRRLAELYLGRVRVGFFMRTVARLMGPIFLRRVLATSPAASPRNLATLRVLRAQPAEDLDLEREVARLLESLDAVEALDDVVPHPLYGTMYADDVRALVRHHTAHHAHQFGLLGSPEPAPPEA